MAKTNLENENELAKYAAETETSPTETETALSVADLNVGLVGTGRAASLLKEAADARLEYLQQNSLEKAQAEKTALLQEHNRSNGNGFMPISIQDLPTKGMFYPAGTRIWVKAATLADIKHWSATDETSLTSINDALNYILQSCCRIVFPESDRRNATFRDLKDIDRFYIILAIHDFTYPGNQNNLSVKVNENTTVTVKKDNIDFVKFSDKLLKFYNEDKRCFSFPVKAKCFEGGMLDLYIPSTGVTSWLKDYMDIRQNRKEGFDQDILPIASMLISDHRGLDNDRYYAVVDSTIDWTPYEWTLVSKVRRVIESAVEPVLNYVDDGGIERKTPLNFRGGIKAIFEQELDIDL